MREIKLKVVTISNVDNCLIEISEPMSVKKVGDYIAERIDKDCVERYEYIQFTGLKDKNGKEIYEGDYVKYNYGGRDMFGEICWDVIAWCVDRDRTGLKDFMCRDNGFYEAIGNIYENPELLTNN